MSRIRVTQMDFGWGPFGDSEDLWRELSRVEEAVWPAETDPALALRGGM